jgi:predicted O-methyltransferase YrrM
MTPETWSSVDEYLTKLLIPADAALAATQRAAEEAGLPAISVSAPQGKFLHLLARIAGARRILEIGTLAGYSTIWLARALPAGGRLVSLEFDPKHAAVAKANVERAGLAAVVDIRVGRAIDALPGLEAEERFDFVFIDADKPSTPAYFEWALKLTRKGGIIIVDNVVRSGSVTDTSGTDDNVEGMRRFLGTLAGTASASGTVIQTVGAKGYDGFALIVAG